MVIDPKHPRISIGFYVDGRRPDDPTAEAVRLAVESLASSRKWTIGPPEFVDRIDDMGRTRPEDQAVRSVGAFFEQWANVGGDWESAHASLLENQRAERKEVVDTLSRLSKELNCEFAVGYGNEIIDWIRPGFVSEGILQLVADA